MTDRRELEYLKARMNQCGAKVTFCINTQGYIDAVFMVGKGIKKEYWESLLSAAEFMRRYIYEHEQTQCYGGTAHANFKERFSNGRWR